MKDLNRQNLRKEFKQNNYQSCSIEIETEKDVIEVVNPEYVKWLEDKIYNLKNG